MNSIEGMEEMYLDLIQPSSLIELFENTEDFRDWLQMGTREEMGWALKAFERDELYSYCKIIKEEMKISS
jgi:hypothetical protein|tara:strand:+ start:140 stop:349 length:210 start_codon:yes stop_codon:yes gene_type:complete